jgi:ferredoxin
MAEKSLRLPQNSVGRFYIDSTCCDCDLCRQIAPDVFQRNDEIGSSFVAHQPSSPEGIALAQEAVESCPTESIGNDGPPVLAVQSVT